MMMGAEPNQYRPEAMSAYLLHKWLEFCNYHITVSFSCLCGGGQGNAPLLYAWMIGSNIA